MIIWLHQSIWWYVSRLLNRPREWRYLATKNLVEAEEVPTALQGVDAGYHRQLRDLTIDLCTSGPRSTDGLSIHQESSPYHCDTKFGEVISPFPLIHTLQLIQLFGWDLRESVSLSISSKHHPGKFTMSTLTEEFGLCNLLSGKFGPLNTWGWPRVI